MAKAIRNGSACATFAMIAGIVSGDVFNLAPERRMVYFVQVFKNKELSKELWEINVRTGERRLLMESGRFSLASVSPNGRFVAFLKSSGPASSVHILDTRTRTERMICESGGPTKPSWSPYSSWIALITGSRQLRVVSVLGEEAKDLASGVSMVRWLPDGLGIVYYADDGIWYIRRDGTGCRQIAFLRAQDLDVASDGKRVVFHCSGGLKMLHLQTGMIETLSTHVYDYNPRFSPDGRKIAFYSNRDCDRESASHIYCMDSDGTNVRRLTRTTTFNIDPKWSPDGRWIVFLSYRDGAYHLYKVRPDGTGLNRLTDHPFKESW